MTTKEELQAAWQRVCGSSESYGIDEDVDAAAQVVDDAIDELTALRKEREQLIGTIDEWRDRLDAITPKDLEAAWHVVNRAVTGEAEDRALFLLSDGIIQLGRLRAWRDRAVPIIRDITMVMPEYRVQPEEWYCIYCGATTNTDWGAPHAPGQDPRVRANARLEHMSDCPVTQARALLAESEVSDAH